MALNRPERPNSPWRHCNPALEPSWLSGFPRWRMRKYQMVISVSVGTDGSRRDPSSPISFAALSAFAVGICCCLLLFPGQQFGEGTGPGWGKQPTHIPAVGFLFSLPEMFISGHLGANKNSERDGELLGSSAFQRASDVKTKVRHFRQSLCNSCKAPHTSTFSFSPCVSGAQRFPTSHVL